MAGGGGSGGGGQIKGGRRMRKRRVEREWEGKGKEEIFLCVCRERRGASTVGSSGISICSMLHHRCCSK